SLRRSTSEVKPFPPHFSLGKGIFRPTRIEHRDKRRHDAPRGAPSAATAVAAGRRRDDRHCGPKGARTHVDSKGSANAHDHAVMERLFPRLPGVGGYRTRLQDITRTSNTLLFQVVEEIAAFYETSAPHDWSAIADHLNLLAR